MGVKQTPYLLLNLNMETKAHLLNETMRLLVAAAAPFPLGVKAWQVKEYVTRTEDAVSPAEFMGLAPGQVGYCLLDEYVNLTGYQFDWGVLTESVDQEAYKEEDAEHNPLILEVVPEKVLIERWPRLVGHEFDFVKWGFADVGVSMAPLAAPCAGQERAARWGTRPALRRLLLRGQVGEVERIWRVAVKCAVRPARIIKIQISTNPVLCRAHRLIRVQIHLLVLDRFP